MKFSDVTSESKWSLYRSLCSTSLPLMLGMAGGMIMMLVDRLTLAYYSELTLAASGPAIFTLMTFIMFFTGAAAMTRSFVAQAYGSGKNYRIIGLTGLVFSFILSIFLLLLYPVIIYLPELSKLPPVIIQLEQDYFRYGVFYGALMVINTGCASYLNGIIKTRTVMKVSLCGQAINIILTPMLVFGYKSLPELGMVGSAVGTLIATFISMLIYLCILTRLGAFNMRWLKIKKSDLAHLLNRGCPAGLTAGFDELANAAFIWVVGALGVVTLTGLSAIIMINYIMIIPIIGLATGVSVQVANKLGANNMQQVSACIRAGFVIGILYVVATSAVLLFLWKPILGIISFKENTQTFLAAKHALFILWTYPLAFVFTMISSLVLQAFGETRYTFIVRVLITWLLSMPVLWMIVHSLDVSVNMLAVCWLYGSLMEVIVGSFYLYKIKYNIRHKINRIELAVVQQ